MQLSTPACEGKWWLFELAEKDHWIYENMKFPEMWHLNNRHMEQAAEMCLTCPVFNECHQSTIIEDLEWNMRAANGPTRNIRWENRAQSNAPACVHQRDGAEEVCAQCIYTAEKIRDTALDKRGVAR